MHLEERSAERPQASFLALESQQNEAKLLEGWMTVAKVEGMGHFVLLPNLPLTRTLTAGDSRSHLRREHAGG
jgi:hypothetical protein